MANPLQSPAAPQQLAGGTSAVATPGAAKGGPGRLVSQRPIFGPDPLFGHPETALVGGALRAAGVVVPFNTGPLGAIALGVTPAPIAKAKEPAPLVPDPQPSPFAKAPPVPSPPRAEDKPSGPIFSPDTPAAPRKGRTFVAPAAMLGAGKPSPADVKRAFGTSNKTPTLAEIDARGNLVQQRQLAIEAEINRLLHGDPEHLLTHEEAYRVLRLREELDVVATQARVLGIAYGRRAELLRLRRISVTPEGPPSEPLAALRAQTAEQTARAVERAVAKAVRGYRQITRRINFQQTGRNSALLSGTPGVQIAGGLLIGVGEITQFKESLEGGQPYIGTYARSNIELGKLVLPKELQDKVGVVPPHLDETHSFFVARLGIPDLGLVGVSAYLAPSLALSPGGPMPVFQTPANPSSALPAAGTVAGLVQNPVANAAAAAAGYIQGLLVVRQQAGAAPPSPVPPFPKLGSQPPPGSPGIVALPDFTKPSGQRPSDP